MSRSPPIHKSRTTTKKQLWGHTMITREQSGIMWSPRHMALMDRGGPAKKIWRKRILGTDHITSHVSCCHGIVTKYKYWWANGKMEKIYSPNLDGSNIGTNLSDKVTKNPLNLQLQKSNIFILLLSHIFVMLCLLWQHNKYLRFIFNVFVENC